MKLMKIRLNYQFKLLILKRTQNQITPRKRIKKVYTLKSTSAVFDGREMVLNGFKSGIFPITPMEGTGRPDILDRVFNRVIKYGKSYILCIEQKKLLKKYITI